MNARFYLILFLVFSSSLLFSQSLNAHQLIEKSLALHDPNNEWKNFNGVLYIAQTRPDGSESARNIYLNNKKNHFKFIGKYPEGELQYIVNKKGSYYLWNGKREVSDELKKKYKISDTRANMYHNYYSYLYGMPMKLSDPGTRISPIVENVSFKDVSYLRVRVTYDQEVGDDVWYFYFNPNNYELELYQFFHDETKNDGEYILLEGWKYFGQLRLPEKLRWFYNKDDGFLGEDKLVSK